MAVWSRDFSVFKLDSARRSPHGAIARNLSAAEKQRDERQNYKAGDLKITIENEDVADRHFFFLVKHSCRPLDEEYVFLRAHHRLLAETAKRARAAAKIYRVNSNCGQLLSFLPFNFSVD